jgi:hypothetical protein
MLSIFYKLCLSLLLIFPAFAEEHHAEGAWELGVAVGYANLITEETEGTNIHLHLLKRLDYKDWREYLSLGLGLEMIVSDETHYVPMLTLAVHPLEDFTLAFSAGMEFAQHESDEWESIYTTHIEATYVFDVSEHFHLGPVIGYSTNHEGEHYTVGIHIGIPL